MSYSVVKSDYSKEPFQLIEVDVVYCGLDFGVAPCTATGSGDAKCYNCRSTCQDIANFDSDGVGGTLGTILTLRHCEPRSPHPIGLANVIPDLESASISPAQIDLKGGLGVRASVSLSFVDAPHSDIGIDKYVSERTYNALERGTYWTKTRSRFDNYQNQPLRHLSGYLIDGVFDAANFQTRYYIVDKLSASDGTAAITGKDPLKLASKGKAQTPQPSNGKLAANITDVETSATLSPVGVGAEYDTSGYCLIRSEIMAFTRVGDVLTLTRAQYNTIAEEHSLGDTVQECRVYPPQTVDLIAADILTRDCNIPAGFIPSAAWSSEVTTYINGNLEAIIAKPFDSYKLLKELAEAKPHYLWWDERSQLIQLTALRAPDSTEAPLTMGGNILKGSFRTQDKPELRKSTIYVNYGQYDPTKKLDEPGNYQASYLRVDTESVAKYSSNEIQTINTRWIPAGSEASARQLAALIGRRFADIPRQINFSLAAKDSDVWVGQSRTLNHRDVVDGSGLPVDTVYQIMSANESRDFNYQGLEFTYGESLPEDEGGGEPGVDLVFILNEETDINLLTRYTAEYGAPTGTTKAKFILDSGRVCGSTSNATYAIDTDSWPAGALVTLQTNINSLGLGKGGDGENPSASLSATDGGPFMILNNDLELINNGIIGGGGGGGGRDGGGVSAYASGGGGAGFIVGAGGGSNKAPLGTTITINTPAKNGSNTNGGSGGYLEFDDGGEPFILSGGAGGDLGQAGETKDGTGGNSGVAINRNGYTLTLTEAGDIRGSIIN